MPYRGILQYFNKNDKYSYLNLCILIIKNKDK